MTKIEVSNLSLSGICNSGQVFRMYEREPGVFDVYSADRHVRVSQTGTELVFFCDEREFEDYWKAYFDLSRNYGELAERVRSFGDAFILKGMAYGGDIRILKQDIWEMMISFIISQQKQIPSIRKCIEALCDRLGRTAGDGVCTWKTFPTAQEIAAAGPEGIRGLSLGYRERYIYETSVQYLERGISNQELVAMNYEDAKKYLLSFTGIGEKVANCILLFGAGFVDAFPIDTHIKDILYREYYLGECADSGIEPAPREKLNQSDYERLTDRYFSKFSGFRGIVQQWIFAREVGDKTAK